MSKKLTPSSTSLSSCACASASSFTKEPHVIVPAQSSVTTMSDEPNFLRGSDASRLMGLVDEGESARQHGESSASDQSMASALVA